MKATHDITKLPVWARSEIERLRSNLRMANGRLADVMGGDEHTVTSNVMLPYFKEDMHDQYLPKDQRVQFLIPHPWVEARPGHIEVRHIDVNSIDIHGSQPIWIEPGASNCCSIRFRSRESLR